MLVIEMRFPAGRYHATPWGRHVNEGAVEWPPSPYRLLRALYDAWKRKRPEWEASRVEPLLAALAGPPLFRLPPAGASHTRSYLSQNKPDPSDKAMVFDAFVAVDAADSVLASWPQADLTAEQRRDLNELLSLLNYLGRSESWVEASLAEGSDSEEWNCRARQPAPGEDVAQVACAADAGREGWLNDLAYSTGELLKEKRERPPTLRYIDYARSRSCFTPKRTGKRLGHDDVTAFVYGLESRVAPRVEETVEIAERVRTKLMGIHRRLAGGADQVSFKFSGKDRRGDPLREGGHRHAFIMPLDEDGDGKLDRLVIRCSEPFDVLEQKALDELLSLWQADGRPDLRVLALRRGPAERVLEEGVRFRSASPFVPARHYKKSRGEFGEWLTGELARECGHHGLPAPLRVHPLERCPLRGGRSVRWLEFRRNRKEDAARPGFGFELEFGQPVRGPFALGYGCHFGLGAFVPA